MLVGHSGAGVLFPMIAEPRPGSMRVMFVDAGVPPCHGAVTPGGDFLEQLRELAVNKMVPRWSRCVLPARSTCWSTTRIDAEVWKASCGSGRPRAAFESVVHRRAAFHAGLEQRRSVGEWVTKRIGVGALPPLHDAHRSKLWATCGLGGSWTGGLTRVSFPCAGRASA